MLCVCICVVCYAVDCCFVGLLLCYWCVSLICALQFLVFGLVRVDACVVACH